MRKSIVFLSPPLDNASLLKLTNINQAMTLLLYVANDKTKQIQQNIKRDTVTKLDL